MTTKMGKKTIAIIIGVAVCLVLAVWFGLHILAPALDPVVRDMIKIFFCGAGCGLLLGLWIGIKIEKITNKVEDEKLEGKQ